MIFLLAAVSDFFDGFVARVFNQKSMLGSYLDPIADKLLLASSFVVLALKEIIPSWLTVIVISRDVLISLGILVLFLTSYKVEIKPSIISKITTTFQIFTVLFALFGNRFFSVTQLMSFLIVATAVLTLVSGFHYIYRGIKIVGKEEQRC